MPVAAICALAVCSPYLPQLPALIMPPEVVVTPLRQRFMQDLQLRHRSAKTVEAYVFHVRNFARHFNESPAQLGGDLGSAIDHRCVAGRLLPGLWPRPADNRVACRASDRPATGSALALGYVLAHRGRRFSSAIVAQHRRRSAALAVRAGRWVGRPVQRHETFYPYDRFCAQALPGHCLLPQPVPDYGPTLFCWQRRLRPGYNSPSEAATLAV